MFKGVRRALGQAEPHTASSNTEMSEAIGGRSDRAHLLSLPQEIQDMVFELAYSRSADTELCSRMWWTNEEMGRLRDSASTSTSYTMRPFPDVKVSEFLVSKRFFFAASKAYVSIQPFADGLEFAGVSPFMQPSYLGCGIVAAFATEMVQLVEGTFSIELLQLLPSLRRLSIAVDEDVFMDLYPRLPWKEDLTKDDIESLQIYKALCKLSGLLEFKVFSEPWVLRNVNQDVWNRNLKELENAVVPHVTRNKINLKPPSNFEDLHLNSRYEGSVGRYNDSSDREPFDVPSRRKRSTYADLSKSDLLIDLRLLLDVVREKDMLQDGTVSEVLKEYDFSNLRNLQEANEMQDNDQLRDANGLRCGDRAEAVNRLLDEYELKDQGSWINEGRTATEDVLPEDLGMAMVKETPEDSRWIRVGLFASGLLVTVSLALLARLAQAISAEHPERNTGPLAIFFELLKLCLRLRY